MSYKIKHRKIFTRSSETTISLLRKGYKLESVSYVVNGNGTRNYTLIKTYGNSKRH